MKYVGLITLALVAGCTHVSTYRSQDLAALSDDQALRGVSYAMPATQFRIAVTRMLEGCEDDGTPILSVKADAESRIVPGERFELDPNDLSSMFKVSSVGLEYYDDLGTLKSFNAAADDKTGDILQDAVRIGIGIASAAAGNPAGAVGASANAVESQPATMSIFKNSVLKGMLAQYSTIASTAPSVRVVCSTKAKERLATLEARTAELKKATATLEQHTAEVDRMKSLAAFDGFNAAAMKDLVALVKRQQLASDANDAAKRLVAKALGGLQMKTDFVWPPIVSARPPASFPDGPVPFEPGEDERKAICENLQVIGQGVRDPCDFAIVAFGTLTETRARLQAEAKPVHVDEGIIALTQDVNTKGANRGVLVREPVRGMLVVERLTGVGSGPAGALMQGWEEVMTSEPLWIAQLGTLRFLPFTNRAFENKALSLALRRDGRIEKLNYETKDAALARAAASAAKSSKEYAEAAEARETERRDDRAYARTQLANQRADEIAGYDHDIAVLQKSAARIEAAKGKTEQEEAAEAELAQLKSDIAKLTAERDKLKVLQEIATIKAADAGA